MKFRWNGVVGGFTVFALLSPNDHHQLQEAFFTHCYMDILGCTVHVSHQRLDLSLYIGEPLTCFSLVPPIERPQLFICAKETDLGRRICYSLYRSRMGSAYTASSPTAPWCILLALQLWGGGGGYCSDFTVLWVTITWRPLILSLKVVSFGETFIACFIFLQIFKSKPTYFHTTADIC